jgi:hypothetical protein
MELELLKFLAPLGTGGILAWGMFLVYRKDQKGQADSMTQIVKENTAAITELTTYLKSGRACPVRDGGLR